MIIGDKKCLVIAGTHGIPARYGGFETLAENLVDNLGDYEIIVFKSALNKDTIHKVNLTSVCVPLSASGLQGVLYDLFCFVYVLFLKRVTLLYLGPTVGIGLILPWLRGHKIVTNFGGLDEWSRPKYRWIAPLLKFNYWCAAKLSTHLVADNEVLRKSLFNNFGRDSYVIRYGGDHLPKIHPRKRNYYVVVARAQEDSMFDLLIEAFGHLTNEKLIIVSNWEVSEYGLRIKKILDAHENIEAVGPIYDIMMLSELRLSSKVYIHSHSKCGTAPSLVEAICLGCSVISFDAETNRETTENQLFYFKNSEELVSIIRYMSDEVVSDLSMRCNILSSNFKWKNIVQQYRLVL